MYRLNDIRKGSSKNFFGSKKEIRIKLKHLTTEDVQKVFKIVKEALEVSQHVFNDQDQHLSKPNCRWAVQSLEEYWRMIWELFGAALPRSSGRGGKHRYDPCHPYTALLGIHQVHQGGVWAMREGMGTTLIMAPARAGYHWLKLNHKHLTSYFSHV